MVAQQCVCMYSKTMNCTIKMTEMITFSYVYITTIKHFYVKKRQKNKQNDIDTYYNMNEPRKHYAR